MTDNEKLLQSISDMLDEKLDKKLDPINSRLDSLEANVKDIRITLENDINHSIQLLAENHINLVNKLNEAIPAADKNLAYEVKVNHLITEVRELKKEVAELKSKIA